MKFRGRIAVSFIVVMIMPLILFTLAFVTITKTRFSIMGDIKGQNTNIITAISNPISYISGLTIGDYNELVKCLENTPELLDDIKYLQTLSGTLEKKFSYIYITKSGKLIYGENKELYDKVSYEFPLYTGEAGNREFIEDDGFPVIVRYVGTSKKGLNVFLVTNILELETESKLFWGELIISFVFIMLITGLGLSYWLYMSVARPINSLRNSTRNIINGDLKTIIKKQKDDEIGDLVDDFNNMREHINRLLEDNRKKKQITREMIVNISHDLKTPLTVIKGYAEGLREGVANTPLKQDKYLSTIYSKTVEMNGLIDELYTYAKIDADAINYKFISLDINKYLEEGVEEIQIDLEINNFDVFFHPYKEKKLYVIADVDQLKRVINNLISNSKKYASRDRRGRIEISIDTSQEFVKILIEDNGIGIPQDNLSKVFERLYRVDESRNSKIGGSGLGLAIVKKIIEDHWGKVWAESIEGEGTKIIILLRNAEFVTVEEIEENRFQINNLK